MTVRQFIDSVLISVLSASLSDVGKFVLVVGGSVLFLYIVASALYYWAFWHALFGWQPWWPVQKALKVGPWKHRGSRWNA